MAITMTEVAQARAAEIIAKTAKREGKNIAAYYIRLKVTGGGCSGYMHELELSSEIIEPLEHEFVCGPVLVVVDRKSYLYANGSEISYETVALETGFVVKNPNAKSSCGCGKSHTF